MKSRRWFLEAQFPPLPSLPHSLRSDLPFFSFTLSARRSGRRATCSHVQAPNSTLGPAQGLQSLGFPRDDAMLLSLIAVPCHKQRLANDSARDWHLSDLRSRRGTSSAIVRTEWVAATRTVIRSVICWVPHQSRLWAKNIPRSVGAHS